MNCIHKWKNMYEFPCYIPTNCILSINSIIQSCRILNNKLAAFHEFHQIFLSYLKKPYNFSEKKGNWKSPIIFFTKSDRTEILDV